MEVQGDKIFPNGTSAVQTQENLNTVGRIYFGAVVGASGAIYGIAVAFAFYFLTQDWFLFYSLSYQG
ncbi:MAG: hypothetical protein R2852_01180 [Bacteroidia bacterium]